MANRRPLLIVIAAAVLVGIVLAVILVSGGDDDAAAQTVTFEKPTETGSNPFTKPADIKGPTKVDVGSGPYGGTGSDLVCDRELLIKSLRARPDRLRAWATVLGIAPNFRAVARYIRKLKPVTLTRDTRVTNYTFENGRAQGFQAILQAGTAVLVDESGFPVARCRCGNPLTKPIYYPKATCYGCPPNYHPPKPCSDYTDCWETYPDPPSVYSPSKPAAKTTTSSTPTASFDPSAGTTDDTFTLSASGFSPNSTLDVTLKRPDGGTESYEINTSSSGSGSYTFTPGPNDNLGTYTATVRDASTGKTATASTSLTGGNRQQQDQSGSNDQGTTTDEQPPDDSTQTDPSQGTTDDSGGAAY